MASGALDCSGPWPLQRLSLVYIGMFAASVLLTWATGRVTGRARPVFAFPLLVSPSSAGPVTSDGGVDLPGRHAQGLWPDRGDAAAQPGF